VAVQDDLLALVTAQAAARQQATDLAVSAAVNQFQGLSDWWSDQAVAKAVRALLGAVEAAQRQAAATTGAYLTRAGSASAGRTLRQAPVLRDVGSLRGRSVTHQRVYERIAEGYRWQVVAEGLSEDVAAQRAVRRAEVVADDDVTLAMRHQARQWMADHDEADGYRRIIHPELSRGGTCGLCVAASDRVYHRKDLLPIHGRCHCEVLPIVHGQDPGEGLNQDALAILYQAAGGTTAAAALKQTRYQIGEHGELGPVLTVKGQHFRGKRQVDAARSSDPVKRAEAELAALRPTYARLRERAAGGENVSRPLAWQRDRIAQLERVAGSKSSAA
jgi:hypothetical protein